MRTLLTEGVTDNLKLIFFMNVNVIASTRDLQKMSTVQLDKLYEDLRLLQAQVSNEILDRGL